MDEQQDTCNLLGRWVRGTSNCRLPALGQFMQISLLRCHGRLGASWRAWRNV
jgi:hypothetical protein